MSDSPADLSRRGYRRVVAAATIGTFVEIYDLLVYGYFASILAEQFFPRQDPTAALLSTFAILALGAVVRPAGAIIFGHIGDRLGRRAALGSRTPNDEISTTSSATGRSTIPPGRSGSSEIGSRPRASSRCSPA